MSYAFMPQMGGAMDNYGSSHGNFAFKKRFERIDWKKIAAVDVDSIARNLDFNSLQDNIMNITFCNIESEVDVHTMDPNFIKLFKLAQLTVEYLLHSQDYLTNVAGGLEDKLKKTVDQHEEMKKALEKKQKELSDVKKECHKRKKMLMAQQQILQSGSNSYNKCPYCTKAFINLTFLQSHLVRRHPEYSGCSPYNSIIQQQQHVQAVTATDSQTQNDQLEQQMEEIKNRLRLTESQLMDERNARNQASQQGRQEDERSHRQRQEEMDRWKEEQRKEHQAEMEKITSVFKNEMHEVNTKYQAQTSVVDKLQSRLNNRSEDDVKVERDELRRQREEVALLKEELQHQVRSMDVHLQAQMKDKDKKWQDRMKKMEKQHQMQIEELSDALEQSVQDIEKDEVQVRVQYQKNLQEAHQVLERSTGSDHLENTQDKKQLKSPSQTTEKAIKDQVKKATSPRNATGNMEYTSDEEDSEMREITNTLDTAGPSTLRTLQGTGSLSLNATRQAQLLEAIRKNPDFIKGMRKQLSAVFEDMLGKRGIPKDSTRMTASDYNSKAGILKKERQQKSAKLPNYWDIRQQYLTEVDTMAKQRVQQDRRNRPQISSSASSLSNSGPLHSRTPAPRPKSAQYMNPDVASGSSSSVQRSNTHPRQAPLKQPPKPSPRGKRTYSDETITGSQWESSEEEDETQEDMDDVTQEDVTDDDVTESETDDDEETDDNNGSRQQIHRTPPPRPQQMKQSSSHMKQSSSHIQTVTSTPLRQTSSAGSRGSRPVTGGGSGSTVITRTTESAYSTPQAKRSEPDLEDDVEETEDDGSWGEDISELKEVTDPCAVAKPRVKSEVTFSEKPSGSNVARLSASIEEQLHGRSSKKLAGSVDTLRDSKEKSRSNQRLPKKEEEDSDDSLPTISDMVPTPVPKPNARQSPAVRSSTHTTDYSTNTYNTSAWGTNSKAVSTAKGGSKASARSTSNDMDLSDWDDTSEI